MIKQLFDAALGYYVLVVAFAAVNGVRDTLRSGGKPPSTAPSPKTARPARYPHAAGGRRGAPDPGALLGYVREFAATAGWATGFGLVLGWLTGVEVYRGGRRATIAIAGRIRDRRGRRSALAADTEDPDETEPDTTAEEEPGPAPADAATRPEAPVPAASADSSATEPAPPPAGPEPVSATPEPSQPSLTAAGPDDDLLGAPRAAATVPRNSTAARVAGERHLFLVTDRIAPAKEPEITMAAGEITDIPTLMTWTRQTAGIAEMEAVDAGCVARDAAASVEFCQETVARIAGEIRALDTAISIMRLLGVDRTTLAAYQQQLERLKVYHDATVRVADACAQLAGAASASQAAAANYQDSAETSLRVVIAHQVPHLEAAQATGHSGAHGVVYGAEDTRSGHTLPPGR